MTHNYFLLLMAMMIIIPYINKAIKQYYNKNWIKSKITLHFVNYLFWVFGAAWAISWLLQI